jgi:hypothetical protein
LGKHYGEGVIPKHNRAEIKIILVFKFFGFSVYACSVFALIVISNGMILTGTPVLPATLRSLMKAKAPGVVRSMTEEPSGVERTRPGSGISIRLLVCLPLYISSIIYSEEDKST